MNPILLGAIQASCGLAIGLTCITLPMLFLVRRRKAPAPLTWPTIAILRPCAGADPLLYENLLSSATAPYGGRRRVILLVPDEADPSFAAAQAAAAVAQKGGRCEVEVVLTTAGAMGCANRKVAQLALGLALVGDAEVLVQADSDVCLVGDDLPQLIAALLADPRAGCAFASPVERGQQTVADRASAALVGGSQLNFLSLYALARATKSTPSLAGALCAHRREALRFIGDFAPLGDFLGEDYEIARRLTAAGYRVALSAGPARCTDGGRGAGEVVRRVGRWLMVVRAYRPGLLWLAPVVLSATPVHLLVLCVLRDPLHSAMALGLWGLRATLSLWLGLIHERFAPRGARGWLRAAARAFIDVLLGEILLLLGAGRALLSRRIEWRGRSYLVDGGGRLVPTASSE